jgi:hypothetical protein
MNWSINNERCISCATIEWKHKGNGYCSKCYPIIKKREIIEQWDLSDTTTLKVVSPINEQILDQLIRQNNFEKARESLLKQIDARLHWYRRYNSSQEVGSIEIELLLDNIARITTSQPLFHGAQERYQQTFNNEQRQIIYKDLVLILINTRLYLNVWKDILVDSTTRSVIQ